LIKNRGFLGSIRYLLALAVLFLCFESAIAENIDEDYSLEKRITLSFKSTKHSKTMMLPFKQISRPSVGLALSGGGIRGIAQIGALKVLLEEEIPIDLIVGASIGGAVGALLASGYSPDEILEQVRQTEWGKILSDSPRRSSLFLGEKEKRGRALLQFRVDNFEPILPEAISPGQQISNIFTKYILNAPYHASDFSELKIPLKILATDLLSGNKIIFDRGDLAQAVRSTVSIPLLFSPVVFDSLVLVDGGVLDNIPVDETRKAGSDIVIAMDTTSPLRSPENLEAPWEIADQITTIMQQENDEMQLKNADIVISFDDIKVISTDFESIDRLYNEGVKRAKKKVSAIKQAIHSSHIDALADETVHIDEVKVEGVELTYLSQFLNPTRSRFSLVEIHNAIERIYVSGDVDHIEAQILKHGLKTILLFKVNFNPLVESITFSGNGQLSNDSLFVIVSPLLEKPVNPFRTRTAIENIARAYRKKGLSLAAVDRIDYNQENHSAHFHIVEGLIQNIDITGLKKTKNFVIDREFKVRTGELFQYNKAQNGIDNIIATDLFSSVNLTVEGISTSHNLKLNLVEKPPFVVRLAANYDTERTARVFAEFADDNFLGTANDLTFHIQYGGRDFKSYLDYRADRLFKSYITGGFNLHYITSHHHSFIELEEVGEYSRRASGLNVTLGQQIGRYGTLSGNLRFEEIDIDPISGFGYDTGSLSINTIGIKTVIDTRDQAPFPSNGKYHIFFYETSSGFFLGADITYFKVMNQLATFNSLGKRHTFCPKVIWGTSDLTTPYSEQFHIGGIHSFYGLREGQLWGRNMMLMSFEYRYTLPKFWAFESYISARYDRGATWNKIESIKSDDFLGGYGVAFAFSTPIGPFTFAYGQTNKMQRQFYFSAGFEF
jgi:NTE family protein